MSILNKLQKHIEQSKEQKVRFRLIYDTSKHKLSADDFHQHCDNKGPTLTILYGINNVEYGGYTKETWSTVTGSKPDETAFIFTTKGGHLHVFKIRDGSEKNAIYCYKGYGPCFGRTFFSGGFLTFSDGPITTSGSGIYKLNGYMQSIASFGRTNESISRTEFNGGSMDVKRLEVYEVCDELNDPWLRIKQSSDQLRQSLQGQSIPGLEGMPFNILLIGQISSGKSSFINTALSAMSNQMNNSAIVSNSAYSETNKFSRYDLTPNSLANKKKVYVFDVRGIEESRGMKYELELILQGHLSLGYEFPELDIPCDDESREHGKGYGRINIVCFVIDSTTHNIMSEKTLANIEDMKRIGSKLEVQRVVVVTKLDDAHQNIRDNHEDIYKSSSAKEDVEGIAKVFGLSQKHVYPVINYTSQEKPDEISNQLVLHALTSMVKLAEDQAVSKLGGTNDKEIWTNRDRSTDYKNLVRKMRKEMSDLPSRHDLVENPVRILMVGSIDSGKSSFINSLCSTLMGRIIRKINYTSGGERGQSKTKEYRAYQLKLKHDNGQEEKMPVRVCDMPGFACTGEHGESTPYNIKMTDISNTVEGHLKSGHKFTEVKTPDNRACDENPTQSKKVHGICIVLSMTEYRDEKATTQINKVIESLEKMPRVIILTKIDKFCTSIDTIYQNSAVAEAAMDICAKIPAVKLSDIYPVKNYTHEASTGDSLDLLILDAFQTLFHRCIDYIETLQDEDDDD